MKNVTLCYIERGDRWLMLHRVKKKNDINHDKWIGVGGKFEDKESPEECMLREAREETGLTEADISLFHFMDLTYYRGAPCRLEVYAGRLKGPAQVQGEENQLIWQDAKEDMFDRTRFAGMGNMGHIMALLEQEEL